MKLLIVLSLLALGCGSEDPPVVPGGPGSGVGSGPGGGTGGVGGVGGAGGIGGSAGGGGAMGACDNEDDIDAIQNAGDTMRNIARDCRVLGVPGCIEARVTGISTECASCYREGEQCSVFSNCTLSCQLDTCSANCLTCNEECIDTLQECTGIPGDGCV